MASASLPAVWMEAKLVPGHAASAGCGRGRQMLMEHLGCHGALSNQAEPSSVGSVGPAAHSSQHGIS